MGWFGTGALDGDDGMDLRDELFDLIGVLYDENYEILQTEDMISELLDKNQDKIYDWLGSYDWSKKYDPRFIQEVYIQATAQIMLDYGVKISERGKSVMIDFAKNDHWAKSDKARKNSMDKLITELEAN